MLSKEKKIQFNNLNFLSKKKVFIPTGTSNLLLHCSIKNFGKPKKVLDFGCGIGVVGITLFKLKKIKKELYASDISRDAIELCKKNAKLHRIKIIAKHGNIFKPWKDEKFDLIINDISGISNKIAKISPWFKNVSCETGTDGTILTNKILKKSKNYLTKNGKIIFPILSLSNKDKILSTCKLNFKSVRLIGSQKWPMPKEFYKHRPLLFKLKKNNSIDFEERFGILTFATEIYLAKL